jgi:hypothetical protein
MVSAAVAYLSAAVSLLLLEALFMQILGVSLALTWPCRLCLFRVLLCVSRCYRLSPFQAHGGRWHCLSFLRPACLFTVHVGGGSSPLSCGVFLPPPLLQAFPLLIAGCVPPLLPSPAGLLWGIPLPRSSVLGRPALFATCFFFVVIVYYSVSLFFPGQGSVCPGGFADLARVVCGSTVYCLAHLVVRVIPNCLGAGIWRWPRGPPSFSI